MNVALVGAELEENLGLRYIASSLEAHGHNVAIVPFNSAQESVDAIRQTIAFHAEIAGLSMIFTSRGREFCEFAHGLREAGYRGHIVAGGPFASFNCEKLMRDFPAFDSVALGEGEEVMCTLADNLASLDAVPGLCYRGSDGQPITTASKGNPDRLDDLPWPKRLTFHSYFGKPIASILTSRGCWRDCAFCSINAWYQRVGGKRFRIRSVGSIVAEMADLYHRHGVRIYNFQDDNFFVPNPVKAVERFTAVRDGLWSEGVRDIAIAVKARPDSITEESIRVLDQLGLFRVFLGVENASENGLRNLNRKNTVEQVLNSLRILNECETHVAYNLLMFEPDTALDDILVNLRFMERHIENPFNFCRAEAYPGTGLECKLLGEGRLLGDMFGYDYRLKDARSEAFHQIANYAFFDRNFSEFGLHYFNMQVDFCYQLLRRFHPETLSQSLRAASRNFVKETNLDTYAGLSEIYDFVACGDPLDAPATRGFASRMRERIDAHSADLLTRGQRVLNWLEDAYARKSAGLTGPPPAPPEERARADARASAPEIPGLEFTRPGSGWEDVDLFGVSRAPVPYRVYQARLAECFEAQPVNACASPQTAADQAN